MDFSFLPEYYPFFITGVKNTLLLSIIAGVFGVILGAILALMKISKNKPLSAFSTAYISFVRGTPLLVQLFIIYVGLPFNLAKITAGAIALSLNSAAYVAEIIRSGIEGIDGGQMEAARSLGMNHAMGMRYIVIPQAFKNVLPVLGNEFISLIKESSLVSVIGVAELMKNVNDVRAITYKTIEPLAIAAILYFIMTFTISKIVLKLERRLKVSDRSK
ncbi:arginine ABC transporter permease protein ArtQ [Gottschalkia acidurici 9a]|uniref:Arginine ABC transporter permease protein ArtQ n=1 Tax=Gottschalkia acidurici (strain ATCC 7906 / DSM 604 / BCRC 14475 / CIP 104303 / KCTC 5404 / NCIMB 10678 / 9a) TaxID=1128398 RepID=K0AWQ5_GOTA9|nr:amino acid ABC transporter permease [Gottschalkia acidurici]AFS78258.1 arginine ABC transporter permease protein ArtQ [Gottschalkia acidurici 9a]